MKRITSLLLIAILSLQMMFVSGITVFADGTETPIVPTGGDVKINGLSIVLNGEIGLTFYVYVDRQYSSGTMEFTFMDEEPITMNITDCPKDNSTRRYMATYHLSAIELSEPVTLTVYDADGNKLAQKSCSAEDYVELLMEDEDATAKEKNVAKTLINYGHYAQLACSEANGWVIGEDFAETTEFYAPTVDTSVFDDYEIEWQNHSAAFNQFAMSLKLDYKTGMHLYFPLTEKPTVTVNGEAVEVTESQRLENNYEIYIEGINALNLEDEYEITVNDVTFTLSAFSYCNLAVQHNTSENTIDAMRALYELYQAIIPKTEEGEDADFDQGGLPFSDVGYAINKAGNKAVDTVIVTAEHGASLTGSILSFGYPWVVIAIGVLALGGIVTLVIVKKKKKTALASGTDNTDEE